MLRADLRSLKFGAALNARKAYLRSLKRYGWRTVMDGPLDMKRLIERFTEYDENLNSGRGFSDSPDSGVLGWFESAILRSYFIMYEVTRDSHWLEKITSHFDRMVDNMVDLDGDGYPSWYTCTYSTAEVLTRKLHNRGTGEILPYHATLEEIALDKNMYPHLKMEGWSGLDIPMIERFRREKDARRIKDAEYIIEFVEKNRFVVVDLSNYKVIHEAEYVPGERVEFAPGFSVTIMGSPEAGDKFKVECRAVRPIWYIVHQGMFLYPVSLFIEAVVKDKTLRAAYSGKVKEYLDLIDGVIVPKIERYWVDVTDRSGAYRFTEKGSERFPNRILPHNQYLAMARTFLVLGEATSKPFYLDRALRMGRYFKENLHQNGDAYMWHYWDYYEDGRFHHGHIEDAGHGSIDVGFAIECCRRGVLFNNSELRRFCKTFTEQMWNGSLEKPKIGFRVNSKEGEAKPIRDWINLAQWDPRIFKICYRIFELMGEPAAYAPYILQGWNRMKEGLTASQPHL